MFYESLALANILLALIAVLNGAIAITLLRILFRVGNINAVQKGKVSERVARRAAVKPLDAIVKLIKQPSLRR